jgi:DNA polymerase III subunit beta
LSPDQTIQLQSQANAIQWQLGGEFTQPTPDPAEFPIAPAFAGGPVLEIRAGDLRIAIDRTTFATDKEDRRYALTSVLLEADGSDAAVLVATDGKCLSAATAPATWKLAAPIGTILLPCRGLDVLRKLIVHVEKDAAIAIRFAANDGKPAVAEFSTPLGSLWMRLADGRFPEDWRESIPKRFKTVVPVSATPFCRAIKLACVMTETETRRVSCAFEPGQVMLRSEGKGSSEVAHRLPRFDPGAVVTVAFDPKYLLDVLQRVGDATATLHLNPDRPVVIEYGEPTTPARAMIVPLV